MTDSLKDLIRMLQFYHNTMDTLNMIAEALSKKTSFELDAGDVAKIKAYLDAARHLPHSTKQDILTGIKNFSEMRLDKDSAAKMEEWRRQSEALIKKALSASMLEGTRQEREVWDEYNKLYNNNMRALLVSQLESKLKMTGMPSSEVSPIVDRAVTALTHFMSGVPRRTDVYVLYERPQFQSDLSSMFKRRVINE